MACERAEEGYSRKSAGVYLFRDVVDDRLALDEEDSESCGTSPALHIAAPHSEVLDHQVAGSSALGSATTKPGVPASVL